MTKRIFIAAYIILLLTFIGLSGQTIAQETQPKPDKYKYKVSVKLGYHDKDNEGQRYFPGAFLGDISFNRKIGQYWSAGVVAEYWQTTADIEQHTGIYYSTHYKSYLLGVQGFFISTHEKLDISIGGVAGKYMIHYEFTGTNSTDNYLDLGLLFSPEYKLSKRFSIAAEISYYRLVNYSQHASLFNFKVGPAFRF